MIKINKIQAYLLCFPLIFILYGAGQLLFFINTREATGTICQILKSRRYENYYVCYKTDKGVEIMAKAGTNLNYGGGDTLSVIYKKGSPKWVRVNDFRSLWVVPLLFYLIPFAIMLALVTGIYFGTKYVIISWRPLRIRLSNESSWRRIDIETPE